MNNQNIPFLDRERKNIADATIEANNNVNEKKINEVNNKIKVKKKNKFISFLIIVICLLIAGSLTYYGVKYITKKMDKVVNTSTTTTEAIDPTKEYISNINKVRKLKSEKEIIYLLPAFVNYKVISIDISNKELITNKYGTYNILSEGFEIQYGNDFYNYSLTKNGVINDIEFLIDDSEYKYYTNNTEIILLNASDYYNHAYIIKNDGSVTEDSFTEEESKITIGKNVYTKENDDLVFNGVTYNYIS